MSSGSTTFAPLHSFGPRTSAPSVIGLNWKRDNGGQRVVLDDDDDDDHQLGEFLKKLKKTDGDVVSGNRNQFIENVRQALFASKIVSYAQGFTLLRAAAQEFKWHLHFGNIALTWRGGCIIRSTFLGKITEAFLHSPSLTNLLLDPWFKVKIDEAQKGWRETIKEAVERGIPVPAFSTAMSYYDGYRTARLPANLLQAQRDFFGAHTYQRIDQPPDKFFHTNWTGSGGSTSSSSYNV